MMTGPTLLCVLFAFIFLMNDCNVKVYDPSKFTKAYDTSLMYAWPTDQGRLIRGYVVFWLNQVINTDYTITAVEHWAVDLAVLGSRSSC